MSNLLHTIASELADATEACLSDVGLDPPSRRFVDVGGVLAPVEFGGDCTSQLSVVVGPLMPSLMSAAVQRRAGRGSCSIVWSARFTIALLRCHPYEGLPNPNQIDTEARSALADGWQVTRGLTYRWTQGVDFLPSYELTCEDVTWNTVSAMPPQGGIRGWTLPLDISVSEHYTVI